MQVYLTCSVCNAELGINPPRSNAESVTLRVCPCDECQAQADKLNQELLDDQKEAFQKEINELKEQIKQMENTHDLI